MHATANDDGENESGDTKSGRAAKVRNHFFEEVVNQPIFPGTSTVGGLQTENQRLRDYLAEPSELPNANGKRRMMDFGR